MDPIWTKYFIRSDPIHTQFRTVIIFGPNSDADRKYNGKDYFHLSHIFFTL